MRRVSQIETERSREKHETSDCISSHSQTSDKSSNMVSRGLTKMHFIVLAMQALLSWNLVLSSSIYVGRHAAGKISEHGPSAVSEGKTHSLYMHSLSANLKDYRFRD